MSSTSAPGLAALSSSLLGFSTIVVGLRFYARHVQKLPLTLDDWIMIPCLLLFVGTTTCTFIGLHNKVMGYPTPKDHKVPIATAEMTSKLYIAFEFLSILTLGCTKISALFFFRRIFCGLGHGTVLNALTLWTLVIVVLWAVTLLMLTGLQCGTHLSAFWSAPEEYARYCHISFPFLTGFAVSDFLLDLWIICLPIPPVWRINMTLKRRLAVIGVFLLAVVGLAACIARLTVFMKINHGGRKAITDPRLVNTKSIYLSVLEAGLSLIAVNLPSLWVLFSKIMPEKVLHNVRSMISLASSRFRSLSRRGAQSQIYSLPRPLGKEQKTISNSSRCRLAYSNGDHPFVESCVMHDIEAQGGRSASGELRDSRRGDRVPA
ncbi:hypothetical protein MMC22_002014 [Lobaria immixta]|nr:hypothetical protein [Lobaria immixta]